MTGPTNLNLDRRIRVILSRISGSSGGESVAAMAALERLLPANISLADVIFVGLHHLRQDNVDPSLALELRRLTASLEEAGKAQQIQRERIRHLESEMERSAADLRVIQAALEELDAIDDM